ncbi:MAG: ATP-binding protein [Bdellovibrionaceae bacterium]|nr:ATP-binding protein [Pseudobdellovibrionaceae bacterium]
MNNKSPFYREILSELKNRSFIGVINNVLLSLLLLISFQSLYKFNYTFFNLTYAIVLFSLIRLVHVHAFNFISDRLWHAIFSLINVVTAVSWSLLLYYSLIEYHVDFRIVSLIHIVYAGVIASASYNLGLSFRDFFLFSLIILMAPILFYSVNFKDSFNSFYILAILVIFFIFIALQRRDYSIQWRRILTQQKEMEVLINSFPAGITLIKNRKYIYVNNKALKVSGLEKSLFIGKQVGFLDNHDEFNFYFEKFSESESENSTHEINLRINNESRLHLLILQKMADDKSLIIAITIDIHEQRQNEVALQAASKMAALGEMSSGLAHEINNPLAVISGQAGQLMRMIENLCESKITNEESLNLSGVSVNKILDGLQRIYKTSFRIASIIKGLRQIARNDVADSREIVSFKNILTDTLSLCETRMQNKGILFKFNLENEEVLVDCHQAQIGQVILNLLNNSIDAIEGIKEKWIQVNAKVLDQEKKLRVEIIDSGKGIPLEVVRKIMNPFFTTKPTGKGTGLGLSISKSIVEQHQGTLYYENRSLNTTFVIELPIASEENTLIS